MRLSRTKTGIFCFIVISIVLLFLVLFDHYYIGGIDDWFFQVLFEQNTVFAEGYRDSDFKKIKIGLTEKEVFSILPVPIRLYQWFALNPPDEIDRFFMGVCFKDGKVHEFNLKRQYLSSQTKFSPHFSESNLAKVKIGMSVQEVKKIMGEPIGKTLVYSESPDDSSYRIRVIILHEGKVIDRIAEFYVD